MLAALHGDDGSGGCVGLGLGHDSLHVGDDIGCLAARAGHLGSRLDAGGQRHGVFALSTVDHRHLLQRTEKLKGKKEDEKKAALCLVPKRE